MVFQTTLNWTAAGGAGGQTIMHWDETLPLADIATSTQDFLTAIRTVLATTTSASMVNQVKQLNTATGALVGEFALGATPNITGNGGANAVPNAAQGLIKFNTGVVVRGRLLRGRIFVPGMASGMQSPAGEVTVTASGALILGGQALVSGGTFGIWHRPVNGTGGSFALATDANAWNEFAVQRRRRQ